MSHRIERSIYVNIYVEVLEGGRGPTIFKRMCLKRASGSLKAAEGETVCL